MAAPLIIPSKFTAVDRFTPVMRKMTAATSRFTTKARAGFEMVSIAERKMSMGLNKTMAKLGRFGKMGLAFGGIIIATSVFNTIKNYEQANADLAAVMGTTIEKNQILADDSKRLGAITAKSATEVVGLQEAYARLGFTQREILNVTHPTINGSIAMNAELSETAELTGAMIRTFDKFSSIDTPQILDQMTLSTQKSALNFTKLQTSLPIVAGAANAAGIPFTRLLSLLGKLSDAGIDASSSSTALRNIFLESAKKGLTYDQILQKIVKNQDKLTSANDEFGKRAAVSGVILAKKLKQTDELATLLNKAAKGQELEGVAQIAADKRLNTLTGTLTLLQSAWEGQILKTSESTGALTVFKGLIRFVTNNLGLLVNTVLTLIGTYAALKTIMWLARTATIAYNIVIGISTALQKGNIFALRTSKTSMIAYKITMGLVTAATWLWTQAQTAIDILLTANPIGLIVMAIAAMITIITALVYKYDEWGAAMSLLFPAFAGILNLIMQLQRHWDNISNSFSQGGMLDGIKAIGLAILDSILYPLQQVMELLGFNGAAIISDFKADLGVEEAPVNPDATTEQIRTQREEKIQTKKSELTVKAPEGFFEEVGEFFGDIAVKLTPTM